MTVTYKELSSIPDLMTEYKGAAKDLAPVIGAKRSAKTDPATGFEVSGVKVDIAHLAAFTAATDQRLGNELPYTYPYVLSFPLAMKVMSTPDFPFNAVGAVHLLVEPLAVVPEPALGAMGLMLIGGLALRNRPRN